MIKRIFTSLLTALLVFTLVGCGNTGASSAPSESDRAPNQTSSTPTDSTLPEAAPPEEFVLVSGGTFQMGSPESEPWRSEEETSHTVTLSDFYVSRYEVTQAEYQAVIGENPSSFSGDDFPVDSVSWLDAVTYCNARSESEGLTTAYTVDGQSVTWDRSANGYRLPTEAEWEYACRAGTDTPFNTETSISAEEANYWGDYPYMIEDNYFNQGNLETKPGVYRQTTVAVGSFEPNTLGLYDIHGNVGEWVWDWYGDYETGEQTDPTGPAGGTRRVYRGGGWNDFAKNLRSAYRATLPPDSSSFNIGLRLVRNAGTGSGSVESSSAQSSGQSGGNILIAYFTWAENTAVDDPSSVDVDATTSASVLVPGHAAQMAGWIQAKTGGDLFSIIAADPYSSDYDECLDRAADEKANNARPALSGSVEHIDEYDVVFLGYPDWWSTCPMAVFTFLDSYDFTGKTVIPFCAHGTSGLASSVRDIRAAIPDVTVLDAVGVQRPGMDTPLSTARATVETWLAGLEY